MVIGSDLSYARAMRIWTRSDLHLNVNRHHLFALPDPRPEHDLVVIAGDLMAGMADGVRSIAEHGLNGRRVIYVSGNHEPYGGARDGDLAEGSAEAALHRNINIFERDAITLSGVLIAVATLWTDYEPFSGRSAAMVHAAQALNAHQLIQHSAGFWMHADAAAEHHVARAFIRGQLDYGGDRKVVVVTHRAPSLQSSPARWWHDLLTAAFASDCKLLVKQAVLWVHGHVHRSAGYCSGEGPHRLQPAWLHRCRRGGRLRSWVGD